MLREWCELMSGEGLEIPAGSAKSQETQYLPTPCCPLHQLPDAKGHHRTSFLKAGSLSSTVIGR